MIIVSVILAFLLHVSAMTSEAGRHGCFCLPRDGGVAIPHPCGQPHPRCTGASSSPSTPSPPAYDYEAERRRQEQEAEERRRQDEARRQREAEEARRQQVEFERQKEEALKQLRGISRGAETIKDQSPKALGLKGGDTFRDTGIKTTSPGKHSPERSGFVAWKQVHCAAAMVGYALKAAGIGGGSFDIEEVKAMAAESQKALNGETMGVECPKAPDPPKPQSQAGFPSSGVREFYQTLLPAIVQKAEKIHEAKEKLKALEAEAQRAKEQHEKLKTQPEKAAEVKAPAPTPTPPVQEQKGPKIKDDPIAKAYAEQKEFQKKQEEEIKKVAEQQKKNQSELEKALAELRKIQELINKINADPTQAGLLQKQIR